MLYQEYKNKMQKLVRILEIIRRFRVLIIFVVLSAIFLSLGFIITKGIVFGSDLEGESFVYGESIDFSAKSIFSKVRYEYKQGDSDWTTDSPKDVGEFKVRAYGKGFFGGKKHGREFSFTVTKREVEIEVKEEAICYGNTPTPQINGLVYGDTVSCGDFTYGDRTQAATVVTPVLSGVVITSVDGRDVTGSYEISVKQDDAIAFVKRPVTITIDSEKIIYNGGELKAEGFQITENTLAFDDQIIASEYPSISNVGEIINDPSSIFVITTAEGLDVTANYEITVLEGLLTVEPRPIIIQTGSQSFLYDDTHKSFTSFTVDESTPLLSGHTAYVYEATQIINASSVPNKLTIKITDEDGNDVTSNYAIEYIYGTLEITKREITLSTPSDSWEYDGQMHSNTKYTISGKDSLVDGHAISVYENATVLEVTDAAVKNTVTYIIKSNGADVSENYVITYDYGTLSVYKRALEIKSDDETHVYDDCAFGGSSYTILSGSVAFGQKLNVEFTSQITDVGDTSSTYKAAIFDGDNDVTSNYDLKLTYGTLYVTKRPITISANGQMWVYDGTPHKNEEYTLLSKLGIVDGHTVVYVKSAAITGVLESPMPNDIEIEIYKGEENKTKNYEISYAAPGELIVNQRPITVTADSITEIYNGKEISIGTYVISGMGIAPNQKETVVIESSRKNWGETENVIKSVNVFDSNGDNVTVNYQITLVSGLIKVEKRPIIFESSSWQGYYDGLSHVCHEATVVIEDGTYGIADGETVEYNFENSIKDYIDGGISNSFSALIADSFGTPTTDNYDISYRFGTLLIDKRPITVVSGSKEQIYDGNELYDHTVTVSDERGMGLAAGETVVPYFSGAITDYIDGGVDNTYVIEIWNDSYETTGNYEITYEYGKLVINKRPINVSTPSATKVYDGEELYAPTPSVTDQGMQLVNYHELVIVSVTSIINAETKVNETVVTVVDRFGTDKTHNYEITYSYGTLEITKRPIEIHSLDQTHIYDAELFIGTEYKIVSGTLANGQVLTVTFTGGITDVIESGAENSFEIKITHNGEDVTDNYAYNLVFGTLTVEKRRIEIAGEGYEWVYDGMVHKNESYVLLSELDVVSKHTVVYVESASIKNVADSPMPNHIKIEIYDGEENKTSNYDIIYATPEDLVITKRFITVTADSITEIYNGEYWSSPYYEVSKPGIAPNQTEIVEIEGSRKNWGKTDNEIKSVTVYDENGENVTENYDITLVDGHITVNKRPITLESATNEKTYDGSALTDYRVEISEVKGMGLAGNQRIEYAFASDSTITDYVDGGVSNVFEATMWDGNEETTDNYDVTYIYGTLTINKRLIAFESLDAKKTYDGFSLENHIANVLPALENGGLVEGQTVKFTFDGIITDYVDGGVENTFTVTIWSNDKETTGNYEIEYNYGTLIIDKRPISISTESASKVYDGLELYLPTATLTNGGMQLVLDHYLSEIKITYIINAEEKANETVVEILDVDGNSKTHNYEITYSYGTLKITKRSITVVSTDDERVYDGTPLVNNEITYNTPSLSEPDVGLAYGKYGQYIEVISSGTITLVGETPNTIFSLEIYDGSQRVTDNYEITKIYGVLKITERPITVAASDQEKQYDGTPLTGKDPAIIGGDGLAIGDTLTATYIGSQTIPGTSDVSIDTFKIINQDGVDVTYCYSFDENDIQKGTLTVTLRDVEIIAGSDTKLYDGTPLTNGEFTAFGIANGQNLVTINIDGSITDAGTVKNVISGAVIVDANGNDVTEYYNITYVDGELTVLKRQIAVITSSAEKVYDATPLTKNEGDVDPSFGDGIAPNQTYKFTVTGSAINVGEYVNTYTLVIYGVDGSDVTHNYEINEDGLGTLVITPLKLHFVTDGEEGVYTGYALTDSQYSLISGNIVSMHGSEIYTNGSQTDVGSSKNTLYVRIFDRETGDESVMSNYEITVDEGELTVTPRSIIIFTSSAEKIYDGTPLTSPEASSNWDEIVTYLAPGHEISLTANGTITSIGETDNTFELIITYNGADATHNFTVDMENSQIGKLKVTPAPLVFESYSSEKKYDGTSLTNHYGGLKEGALIPGHEFTLIFLETSKVRDVLDGVVENVFEVKVFDANGNDITNAGVYPSISCVYGTLEILPYEMTVVTGSAIKQDDGTPLYAPLEIKTPNEYLDELNMKFIEPRFTWSVDPSVASRHFISHVGRYEYSLEDGDFIVYFDGEAVPMTNFDITYEPGTLQIVGKLITIYLMELTQTYNGKPLSYGPDDWYTLDLPEGVEIWLELEGTIVDAGTLDTSNLAAELIEAGKLRIYQNGVDVTNEENGFTITFEGTLTVSKRVIEVTSASATREKTDEPLTAERYWISKNKLANGHRIETVHFIGTNTGVGEVTNYFEVLKIVDSQGNDVTDNYLINYKYGTLTVTSSKN